ncbi:MAG TPA: sporulation integral membrane protein YtvI, partial [Clostridia bacterium]|nr:sporulation integral membrane protein YtvI [Clostridia bacterium]
MADLRENAINALAVLIIGITVTLVIWLTGKVLPLLVPFIIAILISLLMEPMVRRLQKVRFFNRNLAVGATMLAVFLFIGFLIALLIAKLVPELIRLSNFLEKNRGFFKTIFQDILAGGERIFYSLPPTAVEQVEKVINNLSATIYDIVNHIVHALLGLVTAIPGILLFIIIVLVGTYFFSKDRDAMRNTWLRVVPSPYNNRIAELSQRIFGAFLGYIRAQLTLVTITTTQYIIGLYLIGVEYALTIGLLIGFFDLIPVLGPSTIFIPWIIWSFIFGSTSFTLKLTVLYLVVFVMRAVLEAKIVAANIGLHPLTALVSMYIGFKLMGFFGLVLGPIVAVAVQA